MTEPRLLLNALLLPLIILCLSVGAWVGYLSRGAPTELHIRAIRCPHCQMEFDVYLPVAAPVEPVEPPTEFVVQDFKQVWEKP